MDEKGFFSRWILACGFGEFLGIAAAVSIGIVFITNFGEPRTLTDYILYYGFTVAAGSVEGIITGFMQWNVLSTKFKTIKSFDWMFYTMMGAVAAWLIGMSVPLFFQNEPLADNTELSAGMDINIVYILLFGSVSGQVLGMLLGFFQWLVLRRHSANAGKWINANGAAWSVGLVIIFAGTMLPDESMGAWAVILIGALSGLAGGMMVGVITGGFLKKIPPLKTKYTLWEKV